MFTDSTPGEVWPCWQMHERSTGLLPEVAEDEDETEDDTADYDRDEESHVLDAAVNII